MKVSVAVSILILAIGIGLGWQNHERLASAESTHKQLLSEAARSGMMIGSGDVGRVTKLEREDSTKRGQLAARKIIELEKAMDALPENPDQENLALL